MIRYQKIIKIDVYHHRGPRCADRSLARKILKFLKLLKLFLCYLETSAHNSFKNFGCQIQKSNRKSGYRKTLNSRCDFFENKKVKKRDFLPDFGNFWKKKPKYGKIWKLAQMIISRLIRKFLKKNPKYGKIWKFAQMFISRLIQISGKSAKNSAFKRKSRSFLHFWGKSGSILRWHNWANFQIFRT